MNKAKIGAIAVWIVTVLLAVAFVLAGTTKILRQPAWIDQFAGWGYGPWFLVLIGALEIVGALLLLIPRLAFFGAVLLGVIMLGAGYTHLANAEGPEVLRPAVFLALLAIIAWARRPPFTAASE